eukprot:CAMPEP_0197718072 /NCGR_PEP_ID=MMETSP1434-20131217/2360_1 /TAXON_ID=265543 /ORGANISM="Minutocellus polymorphus, Strain CCMP3303" /LENGTH=399 /DNA_ID=CAMNT_0043302681 /DNA_START=298 /DNA_END=1497 /DNA_ORIENTATION=-
MRPCIFLVAVLWIWCCGLPISCSAQKIYAAGRGLMAKSLESAAEVIDLAGGNSDRSRPKKLLYLGTAVYDNPQSAAIDTANYAALGCSISALNVSWIDPTKYELDTAFEEVDIILIAGGNTLFAVDRWTKLGIDNWIRDAVLERNVVVAGGSAGFISLCGGGHSDSMKPESYKNPVGPFLNPDEKVRDIIDRSWEYIRVPGLNLIEGALCCPHYDTIQNNNVSRADDFSNMIRRHSGEYGIAVDEWAALAIDGDSYRVVSRANHTGSVGPNGEFVPGSSGKPGIWTLSVDSSNGNIERKLVPPVGKVSDIIHPPRWIAEDQMVMIARAQNPDDGKPAAWTKQGSRNYRPYQFAIVLAFGALAGTIVSLYWRIKRLPAHAYEELSFVDANGNDSWEDPEE